MRTRGVFVQPVSFQVDGMRCALGEHHGDMWVICSEGVGWEVPDEGFSVNDYDPDCPRWSKEELRGMRDGLPVDLADWVRVFGARLETNHRLWFARLTGDDKL